MTIGGARALPLLLLGDVAVFVASLWLTLWLRYGGNPSAELVTTHVSFLYLFAFWILIFYMAGLYSKRVVLFPSRLPDILLRTQFLNIILAALFFFFAPNVGIAPKTVLVLYLVISLLLVYLWRLIVYPYITHPRTRLPITLIGSGSEVDKLLEEVNNNSRYPFVFAEVVASDTQSDVEEGQRYATVTLEEMYEEVFDRIPLSLLEEKWFLANVSTNTPIFFSAVKRSIDIVGGSVMGLLTLIILPFVYVFMRFEGPGPIFISQERLGKGRKHMRVWKFRSMKFSDSGMWPGEGKNKVTKIGNFLRMTSLDEFPQFLNIFKGEMSLVGPRNDLVPLGNRLAEAIPYYNVRYVVKPGLTGWAQINQQYEQNNISPQSIEETKTRLSYDFYYLKNRSLGLDIMIALLTVKRMFFRMNNW
jgi:lipopolysaccharide/colanic/teichoic acid biosynthesis glycosyltransferase